ICPGLGKAVRGGAAPWRATRRSPDFRDEVNSMNLIRYLVAVCLLAIPTFAQTATLHGQVTDESGAIVQGAKISLSGPGRLSRTGASANDGSHLFADPPSGSYTVHATAPGLALRQAAKVDLKA